MRLYFVLALLPLTACMSPTEVAQQQCYEFGFQPGDKEFSKCVMTMYQSNGMYNAPPVYMPPQQEVIQPNFRWGSAAPRQGMNCRSYQVGNQINTDCN
jgi:hypothetical protein